MIPKKIHFIWVGGDILSDKCFKFIEEFKTIYGDYEIKVWTDEDVISENLIPTHLKECYYIKDFPPAFKADILRYLIINKYGGLYFDVDFQPIKKIPDVFLSFDFLGGIQNNGEIAIGFFASKKDNALLKSVIESIPYNIEKSKRNGYYSSSEIHRITGPEFFNEIAKEYLKNPQYFFFTKDYFYPYWFEEKERSSENFKITSPLSYAVHHWSLSWKK